VGERPHPAVMHVCDLGTRGHCETSAPAFAGDQGMRPAPAADLSGSRPSARQPGAVEVMAGTLTGRPRHDEARARQLPSTRSARRSGRTEVGSSRDVPPRAETLKSCKMCAVDTTPSATCPAQMVCALRDCIHDPINGPTSRGIFGQADAALISCCALGHAAATTFVPRRCDFATPRQLTGVASHLERGGVRPRRKHGWAAVARDGRDRHHSHNRLSARPTAARADQQSRITRWPSRGWPRCLRYGHDENILPPYHEASLRVATPIGSSRSVGRA
jgi:hypothetical protein